MRVVRGCVQVRHRVMGDADMGRASRALQGSRRKGPLAGASGRLLRACHCDAEDQILEAVVRSKLHRMFSRNQDVESYAAGYALADARWPSERSAVNELPRNCRSSMRLAYLTVHGRPDLLNALPTESDACGNDGRPEKARSAAIRVRG